MFLMNITNSVCEIPKYENPYSTVSLGPNKGFRVDSEDIFQVNFYKAQRPVGVALVTDSYYFKANGIPVPQPVPVPEPIQDNVFIEPETPVETNVISDDAPIEPTNVVTDDVNVVGSVEVLTNDENLSAEATYTLEFLTKKKSLAILSNRGVEFDEHASAEVLKNQVLESNPK